MGTIFLDHFVFFKAVSRCKQTNAFCGFVCPLHLHPSNSSARRWRALLRIWIAAFARPTWRSCRSKTSEDESGGGGRARASSWEVGGLNVVSMRRTISNVPIHAIFSSRFFYFFLLQLFSCFFEGINIYLDEQASTPADREHYCTASRFYR